MRAVKTNRKTQEVLRQAVESLEARQMLSSTKANIVYPFQPNGFNGYTPAQIRAAYGFNSVADNGAGQTIALVEAFHDPNINADLHAFDQKYGLSDPTVKEFNQFGGAVSGQEDSDWDTEESLDVEWAHAVAPGANIDIVEANIDTDPLLAFEEEANLEMSLCQAAATAADLPNVSAVSMSWGFMEDPLQANLDPDFATSRGVTFVASSGDSGITGVSYPATSPYVLSVGGTNLQVSNGAYSSESTWVGSTGGESMFEPTPTYQSNIMNVAHRTDPDVSYDADPNTGFNIVVTETDPITHIATQESFGVGGTSAGAPQWAALLAIVNQERVANGLSTLNGATQTLPALYSFYGARRHTAAYYEYHSLFNDITTGQNYSMWQLTGERTLASGQTLYDGGFSGIPAAAGFDQVTGLGTPQVGALADALSTYEPPVATPASRHRHHTTAATTTTTTGTVTMSRAERRRLQAALAGASVHIDVERAGEQPMDVSVQQTTPNAAARVAPNLATAPSIARATLPAALANEVAHGLGVNVSRNDSDFSLAPPNDLLSRNVSAVSNRGVPTHAEITPVTANGSAVPTLVVQPTAAMSMASLPGVGITTLNNLLETSAATTYSTSLQLVRMDAVTAIADAVNSFVQQATANLFPDVSTLTGTNSKPLAVIIGVLAVDAALLGRSLRRRRWAVQRAWTQSSYALTTIPEEE